MSQAARFLLRTPCATLLLVQLLGVLLYPFLEGSVTGRAVIAVFGIVVLGAALLAVRTTPALTWVAGAIAVPAVVLLVVQVVTDNEDLVPWSAGFEAALYFYAAYSLLRYMLADDKVTTDELFAVGAVFTVIAWAFAHVYVVVAALEPHAFTAYEHPSGERSWSELLFLSFTTLSSTGLSDVMPVRPHARSIVMFEQIAGVFYLAMVVTRLIGLSAMRKVEK
ncbi:two pore domain potassium channel family protein [Nocardioides mangrovicus]|uniref:Two pore domain potassium channel family protein n=1 Tax=Nocardioides mangrovicus TaxID=2478913 RepID=A0A3L8P4V6_9ACTN|nr:ion channel [Nocardioides mangrovicus]RLV49783.1 two pore domain potassium channel family protein [Nocardioides mangrovicus]